jgi:hypothetical protein
LWYNEHNTNFCISQRKKEMMPARTLKQHIGAIAPLYELSENAKRLSYAALRKSIPDEERHALLSMCLEALKGLGFTSSEVSAAIHSAFPQESPEDGPKNPYYIASVNDVTVSARDLPTVPEAHSVSEPKPDVSGPPIKSAPPEKRSGLAGLLGKP